MSAVTQFTRSHLGLDDLWMSFPHLFLQEESASEVGLRAKTNQGEAEQEMQGGFTMLEVSVKEQNGKSYYGLG